MKDINELFNFIVGSSWIYNNESNIDFINNKEVKVNNKDYKDIVFKYAIGLHDEYVVITIPELLISPSKVEFISNNEIELKDIENNDSVYLIRKF